MRALSRPHWMVLAAALVLLAVGVVILAKPHGWASPGGFMVVIGAQLAAWYVHRLARWMKDG